MVGGGVLDWRQHDALDDERPLRALGLAEDEETLEPFWTGPAWAPIEISDLPFAGFLALNAHDHTDQQLHLVINELLERVRVLLAQLLVTGVSSVQHGIWQAPTMPSDSGAYRGRS
jgi:hypothetical protein